MLKNYIKTAWKVLLRHKFFTFISLFGISFTLMVLMVLTAFIDHIAGANYPEVNRDRTLHVSFVKLSNEKENSTWQSGVGFHFFDKYLKTMKTPGKISFVSRDPHTVNAYAGDNRMELFLKYTDATFWEIMEFQFLEGKPFGENEIQDGTKVAIINEATKKGYFGEMTDAVGQFIEIGLDKYKVIGVVKGVPITRLNTSADVYLPYSTSATLLKDKSLIGGNIVFLLADSKADLISIKAEFGTLLSKVQLPEDYTHLTTYADTYMDSFIHQFGQFDINPIYLFASIFAFLFMLLPTINLVNLNITRIMERSSEIGVRKAFGASSTRLVEQFLVENLLLTFIGGLIGIFLTGIVIYILNNSGFIQNLDLAINLKVLILSFLVCLIFGFLSGVLPALRMSKMNVVTALKAGAE